MNIVLISILLGIGGMVGWGVYDFLGGVFSKQVGPFKSFFWSQLASLMSVLLLALVFGREGYLSGWIVFLSSLAAMAYSAGYLFFFRGMEKGNVSIVAATMNLWAVFTMIFAFVFLGQRLTFTQTIGAMLILTGATLAALDWHHLFQRQDRKLLLGVKESILGAFFFGVFWNISELISERAGWLLTTFLVKLGIVAFLSLLSMIFCYEIGLQGGPARTKLAIAWMGGYRSERYGSHKLRVDHRRCYPDHAHRLGAVGGDHSPGGGFLA